MLKTSRFALIGGFIGALALALIAAASGSVTPGPSGPGLANIVDTDAGVNIKGALCFKDGACITGPTGSGASSATPVGVLQLSGYDGGFAAYPGHTCGAGTAMNLLTAGGNPGCVSLAGIANIAAWDGGINVTGTLSATENLLVNHDKKVCLNATCTVYSMVQADAGTDPAATAIMKLVTPSGGHVETNSFRANIGTFDSLTSQHAGFACYGTNPTACIGPNESTGRDLAIWQADGGAALVNLKGGLTVWHPSYGSVPTPLAGEILLFDALGNQLEIGGALTDSYIAIDSNGDLIIGSPQMLRLITLLQAPTVSTAALNCGYDGGSCAVNARGSSGANSGCDGGTNPKCTRFIDGWCVSFSCV